MTKTWKITWDKLIYMCQADTKEDALKKFSGKIVGVKTADLTFEFSFLHLGDESINVFLKRYSGLSKEEAQERFSSQIKIKEEV